MKTREQFRPGKNFKVRDEDAGATPLRAPAKDESQELEPVKQRERALTAELIAQIAVFQDMLYAQRRQKLLLVLQGMDTSGKDGTAKALFSQISPVGLRTVPFKAPSLDEQAHDFLWRVHRQVPALGEIAVFNRSHYEDVLVPRVHGAIDARECERRYGQIRDFERLLSESGTVVVKVFLHISKEEQRQRLQERIEDPEKQWKFDPNDIVQRELWDAYQNAYQRAIAATDADNAPWYVVPADSKTHRNLIIATLLVETLQSLKLRFPEPDPTLSKYKVL